MQPRLPRTNCADRYKACGRSARLGPRGTILLGALVGFVAVVVSGCGAEFRVSEERYVRPEATVVSLPTATPVPQQTGAFVRKDNGLNGTALVSPARSGQQYLLSAKGEPLFTWLGTGTAMSAQLVPDGSLLRSVDTARIDAASATGTLQLVGDGKTLWTCSLSEPWFGGLHFRGEALWIPPDEERGTAPWGSIMASVYLNQSPRQLERSGKTMPATLDSVWADGLVEIVPALSDEGVPTGGGAFRAGECGEVVWEWYAKDRIANDASSAPAPQRKEWTNVSQFAYNADDDMVALALTGIGEVWIVDHSISTDVSASDAGAATLLARWNGMKEPTGVAWTNGRLYAAGDGEVTQIPLDGDSPDPFFTYDGLGRALLQGLDNGHLVLVDTELGRLSELDRNGTVYWDFVSPIVNDGAGDDDRILAPSEPVESGANRLLSAHVYPPDFPGLPPGTRTESAADEPDADSPGTDKAGFEESESDPVKRDQPNTDPKDQPNTETGASDADE